MSDVMPQSLACARCASVDVHRLDYASENAWVDYYRCAACGHVWNVPRPLTIADRRPMTAETVH